MTTKLFDAFKSNVFTANNVRIALFVLMVILFVLGAGAPSDGGGLGGFAYSFGPGF
jgi:hypothetical protein